jgi:hypothetical protein
MAETSKIPPPDAADFAIDLERFYRFLSGDMQVYGIDEDLPSTRAVIRRLVAAEGDHGAACDELGRYLGLLQEADKAADAAMCELHSATDGFQKLARLRQKIAASLPERSPTNG